MESIDLESENLSEIYNFSLMIQIAAAGVATSFVLILLPNVETISFTAFLLGYTFRKKFAFSTILLTAITWEILATMVFSTSGIIFPFKLIAWILITFLGTISYNLKLDRPIDLAIFGAISGFIFDILVTIPYALVDMTSFDSFISIFISGLVVGLYFSLLHIIGNAILFSLLPIVLKNIRKLLEANHKELLNVPILPNKIKKRRLILIVIGVIIISSLVVASINQPDTSPNQVVEVNFTMTLSYSGILPNETNMLTFLSNMTVFDVLNASYTLDYTYYGNAVFIDGINGILNNRELPNHNWIYYVNGEKANQASNFYLLENVDSILWNYEGS